jgi:hypothetical protein
MTAQASDILINEHPRVALLGLHLYGIIRNDIRSNHGWGDRYVFTLPPNPPEDAIRCSALWRGYTATFRLDESGSLTLVSYRYPLSLSKAKTESVNESLNGNFWMVLKPAFSAPRVYVPFIDGKIVEDESKWVVEDREDRPRRDVESRGRPG